MTRCLIPAALAALALGGGCAPGDDDPGTGDGNLRDTPPVDHGGGDADDDSWTDDCSAASRLVYVIDSDRTLYRFDPRIADPSAFQRVGQIACAGGTEPNSMGVSRDGFAYVLFGRTDVWFGTYVCEGVFPVNIETAECGAPTPFACGAEGFNKFGMGYATDAEGITDETLFLGNSIDPVLGTLDVGSGAVVRVGASPEAGAEFTGNARGELWGYFPYLDPPSVIQVDKTSGAALQTLPLYDLTNAATGDTAAWAFAFWGGSFYIFYEVSPPDSSTNVWKLEYDGTLVKYIEDTGLRVVGAGVSTCAPVVLI